jgi:hypothetical protein
MNKEGLFHSFFPLGEAVQTAPHPTITDKVLFCTYETLYEKYHHFDI